MVDTMESVLPETLTYEQYVSSLITVAFLAFLASYSVG